LKSILALPPNCPVNREFAKLGNQRDEAVMNDTFELFRRDSRTLEIVTFDELFDRAKFITKD